MAALFGKLNNVMNAKRIVNQPLSEEKRSALEEEIIFGGMTKTLTEEVHGAETMTSDDLLEESVISDPRRYARMKEDLLKIKNID